MINKKLLLSLFLFTCSSEFAVAQLLKNQVFESNNYERTYDIYLPKKQLKKGSPLVVLLHGHRGDADVMTGENGKTAPYKKWLTIAEREGWVLLIPDGEIGSDNYRGWNDCRADATTNPETNDVNFITNLIDTVSKNHPINTNRIYAHGTSNGGNMVFRLALESGEKFRAIAAVVAAMPNKNKCEAFKVPISVLVMNGTDDPILPYGGGSVGRRKADREERGSVISTQDTIKYWLNVNGIDSNPLVKNLPNKNIKDRSTVSVEQYRNRKNNTEVILFKINGGGHTEPSLSEHYRRLYKILVGKQNRDIEMAEKVWEFFERNK